MKIFICLAYATIASAAFASALHSFKTRQKAAKEYNYSLACVGAWWG